MSEYLATVTSKGQVTLPAEIRRELRVRAGDQILFRAFGNRIDVVRSPYALEQAFGSVPALQERGLDDLEDQIDEAMQDHADDVVDRMRRGSE